MRPSSPLSTPCGGRPQAALTATPGGQFRWVSGDGTRAANEGRSVKREYDGKARVTIHLELDDQEWHDFRSELKRRYRMTVRKWLRQQIAAELRKAR